jgi:hypothetical protein
MNRLDRVTEFGTATGFNLNKRNDIVFFRDEIYVPVPVAEPALHYAPAMALEPPLSDPLANFSQSLCAC